MSSQSRSNSFGASRISVVPDVTLTAAGVEHELTVLENPAVCSRSRPVAAAAKDRPHPGDELARIEGLRQIVVCANLEAGDLVEVVVAGRQHQDGQSVRLPDAPANLEPVEIGEHQVEDDKRRRLGGDKGQRLAAACRHTHREAVLAQVGGDERRDRLLVLDDENGLHVRGHHPPPIDRFSSCAGSERNGLPPSE